MAAKLALESTAETRELNQIGRNDWSEDALFTAEYIDSFAYSLKLHPTGVADKQVRLE